MTSRNLVWWGLFTVAGIWMQRLVPGVDFLAPGLLLALQERNLPQIGWVLTLFVLIQEGLGTLDFGASILWYLTIIFFFLIGHWVFQSENWLFMLLLSLAAACSHYAVIVLMCALQNLQFDRSILFQDCLWQAVLLPVVWKLAGITRNRPAPHENSARS